MYVALKNVIKVFKMEKWFYLHLLESGETRLIDWIGTDSIKWFKPNCIYNGLLILLIY